MTIPALHNCPHSPSGWCLACVSIVQARVKKLEAERDLYYTRLASLLFSDELAPYITSDMVQRLRQEFIDERNTLRTENEGLREERARLKFTAEELRGVNKELRERLEGAQGGIDAQITRLQQSLREQIAGNNALNERLDGAEKDAATNKTWAARLANALDEIGDALQASNKLRGDQCIIWAAEIASKFNLRTEAALAAGDKP